MANDIETISYINPGDGLNHPIDAVTVSGLTLTSAEKELWNNKQDALSFDSIPTENSNNMVKSGSLYSVITENELVTATALNDLNDRVTSLEDFSETDPTVPGWAKASTKPTYTASEVGALPDTTVIPTESTVTGWGFTKNSGTVTGISMNGSLVGTSGIIDLGTVLTSHQDITGKADKSAAIGSLTLSIDSSNYQISLSGTKVDGTAFSVSNVIDLPLESVVVSGSYNKSTKKVVLTLQNGNTLDFSVADLVAGLQSEITSSNKLSADLIQDGNTNKVVTSTEKSTWNSAVRSVTFNGNSVSVSNGVVSITESDPVFSASPAAGISAADISNWNSKTSNTGTLTGVAFNGTSASVSNGVASISVSIPAEVTEATVSSWGFTKNSGTLTSHATHKLNIGSATATAAASNTITYVESLTGTTTATSGNLTITPTLKTITVPTAVTEATVAGWGFTKNVGTLTSESDPVFTSSVAYTITSANISTWNNKQNALSAGTFNVMLNGTTVGTYSINQDGNSSANIIVPTTLASLTSDSTHRLVTDADISNWNSKTSNTGTVTGSGLTANKVVLGNGGTAIKNSTYGISTTAPASGSDDTTLPTSKAVYSAITTALTSVLKYKGTIGTGGTVTSLPATHSVGDVYVVSVSGTYAGKECEVGDYILCKTAGTSANNAHWDVVNGENQVDNKSASLASAGSSATIATVDGTNITISTPASWTGVNKTGTLTGISFNGTAASISNGIASISANVLPSVSTSDNGKILQVSSGSWSLVTPVSVYTSSSAPDNNNGIDGDLYIQTS